jgi:hypothetical protein
MYARTADEAVALVARFERGDGTDGLAQRLEAAMRRFPPEEADMRRLSLLQQRHAGAHDQREFCVTLLYAIAQDVVAAVATPSSVVVVRRVRSADGAQVLLRPSPSSASPSPTRWWWWWWWSASLRALLQMPFRSRQAP